MFVTSAVHPHSARRCSDGVRPCFCAELEPAKPIRPGGVDSGEPLQREVAEVGHLERSRPDGRGGERAALVVVAARHEARRNAAGGEVEADLDLERGPAGLGRIPADAWPLRGDGGRQRRDGGVEQLDSGEAGQQALGHGSAADQRAHSAAEHGFEQGGGGLGEAGVEALRSDGAPERGGGLGEVAERGIGTAQPAEDEGLDKDGAGEVAEALDEAGGAGVPLGNLVENVVEGGGEAW